MTVRLKNIATLVTDCPADGTRPFLSLDQVESGTGRPIASSDWAIVGAPDSGAAGAEIGDVLFGKLRPYLAKTWLVDRPVYASTELMCLRPRPSVEARWLGYLCASRPVIEWSIATSEGTKMPRTSWEKLGEFRIEEIPTLRAQSAIADYVDRETARSDALIAAKRRMVELVEDRFVGFVQSLVDPNSPSAHGRLIPLKYVAKIKRGVFSHRPRNDPAFYDGPYPFIQTGDVARARKYVESWTQTLNDRGLAVSRKFPAGTLTMVIAANIGDVGITTFEACFPDSVVAIEANSSVLDTNYLYFGLFAAKKRLVEMAPVTTQGNLNVERIGSLVVRCPSLEAQRAIADRLDAERQRVDRLASTEGRSIELLEERRRALVTAAVMGELDIPEAA